MVQVSIKKLFRWYRISLLVSPSSSTVRRHRGSYYGGPFSRMYVLPALYSPISIARKALNVVWIHNLYAPKNGRDNMIIDPEAKTPLRASCLLYYTEKAFWILT
jgi:hypothetical protein